VTQPPPAAPRPAATVVLLRDGEPAAGAVGSSADPRRADGAPEILMVRRTRGASFMADAYVFPGGRVEPEDGEGASGFAAAAARELREEAAITVDAAQLVPFAHWITPSAEPKRFDARFFIAALPSGQVAQHDAVETVDSLWASAEELLARYRRGELKLPPPTIRNLEELAPHRTVEAALAWARARPVAAILPKLVPIGATLAIVLPWDPEYPSLPGEGAPIDPAHPVAQGRSRFVLEEGRWWGRTAGG
jgi:8-oxo-dGTP pyrophosphatase MutT (NUDIX family)